MYDESKSIYIIVAFFVVVLALAAYLLQGKVGDNVNSSLQTSTSTQSMGTSTENVKSGIGSSLSKVLSFNKKINNNTVSTATTSQEDITKIISDIGEKMAIQDTVTGAIIKTNLGNIEIEFATSTPNTVTNFISLVAAKFYDGIRFHRVIRDFMIQGGDPLSKDINKKPYWGTGGPGYTFSDELTGDEVYPQGTVAMANSGPNTNGSRFFIVTAYPGYPLPPQYTVFGHVVTGMDVALNIQNVKTDNADRPINDVVINEIILK